MTSPEKLKLKPHKAWLIGGGVAAVGVIYYMRKKSAAAAASTASASATTPTDPSIDPATGIPYSQEQSYGYGSGGGYSGAYGTTPSLYGYQDPTTGQFIGSTGAGSVITAPGTNGEWAQQAESYMVQTGYDAMTVGNALGKYLSGQTLTSDQLGIVQTALAFEGNPPVAVPPPHTAAPGGQTGTTPAGGGSGGGTGGGTTPTLSTPYLRITNISPKSVTLQWDSVPGAAGYHVQKNGVAWKNFTTTSTSVPRSPRATYQVAALGPNSAYASGYSNVATVVP